MSAPPVLLALLLCSAGPEAPGPAVTRPEPPPVDPAVAAILARWEAATADRVPVSEAEKAALRLNSVYSPELFDLSFALRGPIDASDLLARYDWTVTMAGESEVNLEATSRDPLVRAFVSPMSVTAGANGVPIYLSGGRESATETAENVYCQCAYCSAPQYPMALVAPETNDEATPEPLPADPSASRQEIARRRAILQQSALLYSSTVVRAQNVEPESPDARRSPIRTAEYVKPAGDGPIWKLERRLKKTPATRLVNNRQPLTAPRPR